MKRKIEVGGTEISLSGNQGHGRHGGGGLVSRNYNIICEQTQASSNMMTQDLVDTRVLVGMEPGLSTAETEVKRGLGQQQLHLMFGESLIL